MHSLPTKVRCYICCLLALLLWLAGQAEALTIENEADMLRAFPNAEQVGANMNYVVTLDGAKVFMMFDNHKSPYYLILMVVHSPNSKKNVLSASKRLRAMLSERHRELPYLGKGYGTVFVTRWLSEGSLNYSEPLGILFSTTGSYDRFYVKSIGWKDGLLVARIPVYGNASGEVELALDPLVSPVRLIQLRKVRGKVDFHEFLSYPRRMPSTYSSGTSPSNLAAGKSYLRTKIVLYYYSGMYCIAGSMAKKVYYAGIPSAVREALTDGYEVEPITYPAKNHPWPDDETTPDDTTKSDSDDQPDKTPDKAPDTTPENPTEEQDTPTPAPQPATPQREALPDLPADLLNVTPEEALRKYLQTLHQM